MIIYSEYLQRVNYLHVVFYFGVQYSEKLVFQDKVNWSIILSTERKDSGRDPQLRMLMYHVRVNGIQNVDVSPIVGIQHSQAKETVFQDVTFTCQLARLILDGWRITGLVENAEVCQVDIDVSNML